MRLLPLLLLACDASTLVPTTTSGLCEGDGPPSAELSQGDAWGLTAGTAVEFGIPPQGGAPYAPFEIRLLNMPFSETYDAALRAYDVNGEVIGTEDVTQSFVCANVGENEGTRYTPEVHMRFYGFESADLDGDSVTIEVAISGDDDSVLVGFEGTLDWSLGPMDQADQTQ